MRLVLRKVYGLLTSNSEVQILPPSTSFWIKFDRAFSTRSRAFAMHRKASFDATGSSLNAVNNARSMDKFVEDERYSDPDGFLPRLLTARSA
jgi:hypothetical protein